MSPRPASSWPWLDDVLVDAGVFDDDSTAGTDVGSDLAEWLGADHLAHLIDPERVATPDDWATLTGELGAGSLQPAGSDHDPFHFDPTPPGATGGPDLITEILLEAIDSAPGFVVDPMPGDLGDADLIADDATPGAPDPTSPDHDAHDPGAFPTRIDLGSDNATGIAGIAGIATDGHRGFADDHADGTGTDDTGADAGGDLDDFDGVDGLDDFDGL